MKKLIKKKDPGFIENILMVFAGIFVMCALFFLMLSVISGIQMKNKIDQTARRAVLLMETYGYIDNFSKKDLLYELEKSGVKEANIKTRGYDREGKWGDVSQKDPADYGQKIQVEISGKIQIHRIKTDIRILRTSTSKN